MNTKDKFNILQKGLVFNQKKHFTIAELVGEIRKENQEMNIKPWKEPEWGFCKGRRNYKENDYDCAVREMEEETGYSKESMTAIKNINTFEEIFIGSNFKCYKHKYYLMHMTLENSLKTGVFEKTEVSCIKWAPITECLGLIRGYNIEKKRMIINVENALNNYTVFESR
jgi:8-oxo-dGTP pyrophosphatase MutT (NUDIX family)